MSAIFGIVQLDGQPVAPELLDTLRAAVANGATAGALWREGPAGLGQQPLALTRECAYERMPWADADGDLAFSAAGRLDNRAELLALLGVAPAEHGHTADTSLMLWAYQRWGEQCVERLAGDWSFAAWHRRAERLVLARDQYGNTGLHYFHGGGRLAFAHSLPALLALPCVPRRLNELELARLLAIFPGDGFGTFFQAITRLPPAHLLIVERGMLRTRRYWAMEDAPPVELPSDEAYAEAFLEHLGAAVAARLRATGPIGSTLSGGLDSGAVTAIAARELRARGKGLTAFTAVPLFAADDLVGPRVATDEWARAASSAALIGVDTHLPVRADSFTPTATLAWLQATLGEPQHAAANFHWIHELLVAARERGIGVVLTGQVGNGGISWAGDPARAYSLLRAGRPAEAWQALLAYRAASGRSWAGAVRKQLLGPLRRSLRGELWKLRPNSAPWRDCGPLNPAFVRRIRLAELMRAEGHDPTFGVPRPAQVARGNILMPGRNRVGALWHGVSMAMGVEVRDPSADIRLLRFCLGVPEAQYRQGDEGRLLIKRAMRGALPPEILRADRFGMQAADIGRRLLADDRAVEELLAQMERSSAAAEYLDLQQLRGLWADLRREAKPSHGYVLMRGLNVGLFLLTHT